MAKIGGDKPSDIAAMSEQMQKSLKSEIGKFGFEQNEYEKFLVSVRAMRGTTVLKYPNDQFEEYRSKYVKKHEHGLNDVFMFEKWAKRQNDFIPRCFWDKVFEA